MSEVIQHRWGYEMTWADTPEYSAKTYAIKSGERTPYAYHRHQDITVLILQGTAQLVIEGQNKILNAGERYHIQPKIMFRFAALKDEVMMLEVGTKQEDDLVIVEE